MACRSRSTSHVRASSGEDEPQQVAFLRRCCGKILSEAKDIRGRLVPGQQVEVGIDQVGGIVALGVQDIPAARSPSGWARLSPVVHMRQGGTRAGRHSQLECLKPSHRLWRGAHPCPARAACTDALIPASCANSSRRSPRVRRRLTLVGESDVLGPQRLSASGEGTPQLQALLLGWHGVLLVCGRKLSLAVLS